MRYNIITSFLLLVLFFSCSSHKNDLIEPENPIEIHPEHLPTEIVDYDLFDYNNYVLGGRVQLEKTQNNSVLISVEFEKVKDNPLEIMIFSKSIGDVDAVEILKLSPLEIGEKCSSTNILETDLGGSFNFDNILQSDFHIKVTANDKVMFFSELGINELTKESRSYDLNHDQNNTKAEYTLVKRRNGNTLTFFKITENNPSGGYYNATIRRGTYAHKIDRDLFELFTYYTNEENFVAYNSLSESLEGSILSYDEINNNSYHIILGHKFHSSETTCVKADLGTSEKTDEFIVGTFLSDNPDRKLGDFKLIKRIDGTAVLETKLRRNGEFDTYYTLKLFDVNNQNLMTINTVYAYLYDEVNITYNLTLTYEQIINGDFQFELYNRDGRQIGRSEF